MVKRRASKTLTLIEVLVAVAIFSSLSVSLYLLLRSGIVVRKRIESEYGGLQNIYLHLERIGQELRNVIIFTQNDTGFSGSRSEVRFYSLLFDYPSSMPKILKISYRFRDNTLFKTVEEPFKEEPQKTFALCKNIKQLKFYYYYKEKEWKDTWENREILPKGVKIELILKGKNGGQRKLNKYVFIYRASTN